MTRQAGSAGILAGVALLAEFGLFMASGFTPQVAGDAAAASRFMAGDGGGLIRLAVLFGAVGVALQMSFFAGLGAVLQPATPTRAVVTDRFGTIGAAFHGLVALGFWLTIPMIAQLAPSSPADAASAWRTFSVASAAADGLASHLVGLALLAAGWAMLSTGIARAAGWLAAIAGAATLVRVYAVGTPLAAMAGIAFVPSLVLATAFFIWAGVLLRRMDPRRPALGQAPTDAVETAGG
ncbi:MAG: hypothetical protein ABR559_07700 [Gemmatimonadota bacterium]